MVRSVSENNKKLDDVECYVIQYFSQPYLFKTFKNSSSSF
ncbi:hypothetical protein CSB68_3542 [Acinetobacter baumannii]|nr:hypothetical protein CSB68_3542 [Acinetobacter baumannii]